MAIQKISYYRVECEGPCKKAYQEGTPGTTSYLKIEPAYKEKGKPARYMVAVLCDACTYKLGELLQDNGYTLTQVNGD